MTLLFRPSVGTKLSLRQNPHIPIILLRFLFAYTGVHAHLPLRRFLYRFRQHTA